MDTRIQIRKLTRLYMKDETSSDPLKKRSLSLQRRAIFFRFPFLETHPLVIHMAHNFDDSLIERPSRSLECRISTDQSSESDKIKSIMFRWTGIKPRIKKKRIIVPKKKSKVYQWSYKSENSPSWSKCIGSFNTDTEEIFIIYKENKAFPYLRNLSSYPGYTVNPVTKKLYTVGFGCPVYDLKREMVDPSEGIEAVLDFDAKYSSWVESSYVSQIIEKSFMTSIKKGGSLYSLNTLSSQSEEYKYIEKFFDDHQKTGYYKAKKIRQVCHPIQARRYLFEKELMENKTEALLVHGSKTTEENVLSSNLDMRFSYDGNCGKAIYLSNSIEYSNRYSTDRKMYIVKTLIGSVDNHGSNHHRVVTPKNKCDSVCHYQNNPEYAGLLVDIFSIYNNSQCYITHVVDY